MSHPLPGLVLALFATTVMAAEPFPGIDTYDVVWDSPSTDARGSMPLGNGDIALNAWVEADGDLQFYIGKTDAWDDNSRLLKLGRVRVALDPNPFRAGGSFRQVLHLRGGEMVVTAAPPAGGDAPVEVRLWVDAAHPLVQVEVTSTRPVTATASIELWRTAAAALPSIECSDIFTHCPKPPATVVEPDTVLTGIADGIGWYHRNSRSVGPELTMRFQDLMEAPWREPLLHRVFGALIRCDGGRRSDDRHLASPAALRHRFDIHVLTRHPATGEEWLAEVRATADRTGTVDAGTRRREHLAWWQAFWERSRISIRDRGADARAPVVPANALPLRIGMDQGGGSRFAGEIARLSIIQAALPESAISALAADDRQVLSGKDVAGSWRAPEPGVLAVRPEALAGAFTVEAWLRLGGKDDGGRIVDKITPGGSDGFLFDTWPGNHLRLIAGGQSWTTAKVLKPDTWHHVAAVLEHGAVRLHLDGRRLAGAASTGDTPGHDVALGYNLQRFITACAGRGAYPIKFNGSLFVMPWPGKPGDADFRRWGPGYWWQNTRLPYISSCTAGDTDMMDALFRMYGGEALEVSRYRTKRYFGIDGAYFPECIHPWGAVFMESYGWDRPAAERQDKLQTSGWHKWEWVCGPELVFMMQDRYEHTLDDTFLAQRLLPTARAVLAFFDHFYKTDERGRLVMHPAQACETWWDCTNPMPELAGLHAVIARLLALPEDKLPAEDRRWLEGLRAKLPDLPVREEKGVRMLAPAERFADKRNCENPELYAVFPFRLVSFEKPNAALGVEALKHRWDRGSSGWRQDDIFKAYLGLTGEAQADVVARARQRNECRFPAFWGPNYDWLPDQDHGGVLMKAVQAMLMQTEGKRIFLLPAWPREWDVDFKLHAPYRTVVEGSVREGRLISYTVTPAERRQDVQVVEKP